MNPTKSKSTRNNSSSLVVLALFLLQQSLPHNLFLVEATSTKVHIVFLGEKMHDDPVATKKSHYKMLSDFLGSKEAAKQSILYSYRHGFSGIAARLTDAEAKAIAKIPGVVKVIPDYIVKAHTTRSWDFLGVPHKYSPQSPLSNNLGQGTIIGVVDSGVWPESESFKDDGMPPIPKRWKGICEKGQQFNSTNCNKKIIGARWFVKGFVESHQLNKSGVKDYLSARDIGGHGTHTASTAAGNFVKNANYKGLAAGVARGGAPRAHLAIYKALWESGRGASSDILKAIDKAVDDGVDIISASLGSTVPLLPLDKDLTAYAALLATAKGVTFVAAVGNEGPVSQTASDAFPWTISVAATTIDRAFPTAITLGNNRTFWGQALSFEKTTNAFAQLISSQFILADNATSSKCLPGNLNSTLTKGKIVLCSSLSSDIKVMNVVYASEAVRIAGGVGVILAQPYSDLNSECRIPCVEVDYTTAAKVFNYVVTASSPTAKLSYPKTVTGILPSPKVATFSSRGPNSLIPEPDIAAPGVDILAAVPGGKYEFMSGTSMACPHVSGIVALIKSVHKDWSPSAIKSALITTGSQVGTDGSYIYAEGPNRKLADPFDMGGGLVNPEKALDPGLIYNVTIEDYYQFLVSIGFVDASISVLTDMSINNSNRKGFSALDLNLPSITVPNLRNGEKVIVTRTVTNIGDVNSVYKAVIEAPPGIKITIEPQSLGFNSTIKSLSFKVSFFSNQKLHGYYKFGSLTWSDGKHLVRSPIAVRVIAFKSFSDE
ncbi:Subtilisin-like protease SDD1 [Morus notabilis]|uniref:Subtilisin-like protease SDD1 n=1 Tax=Morus notabilis TaxID=981085 RepID=W9RBY2_9ROSA|nr:Subtilisin-like protease SDD1 [Morus notabilis]